MAVIEKGQRWPVISRRISNAGIPGFALVGEVGQMLQKLVL
jgi:hypothetical protein